MYPSQQAQLGGAYYGPPIPPQPYPHQRRRACPCCVLSSFIKGFIAVCVAFGLAVLILWLIFRPNQIKVAVESAALNSFNLTTTSPYTLSYNLSADVSFRNPNEKIGVYYDWLEADAYYDGMQFGFTSLPTFYQGHKNTTVLHPAFDGSSGFVLGEPGVADFQGANRAGVFGVDVWLYARLRYRYGSVITRRYYARVRCELTLPLVRNGSSSNNGFTRTECDVVDF